MLVGNRIIKNRAGIVAQANARPILRGNVIEDNQEDGLVAIANSQPNVGTTAEPGGNVFRRNGRYDINSSASRLVIPAFGNQLALARTSGRVNVVGTGRSVASSAKEEIRATTTPIEILVPPPVSTAEVLPTPSSPPQTLNFIQIDPLTLNQSQKNNSVDNTQPAPAPAPGTAIEIFIPPVASQSVTQASKQKDTAVETLPVLEPAPMITSELLSVPGSNVPIGNPRNPPPVVVPIHVPAADPPLPPTRTTALSLRYRVVVEVHSKSEQIRVRSLVPGAFRTFSKGRVLMQVGAFSDRAKASKIRQMLSSKGLKAAVEQLN